ncbi:hypothetical protein [Dyadobacter fanqingshengii]|uniref:hypothetical protein n=1 Tax=Dyadobacter fanqingshengii TaxID=2906443 RepID=UPI0020C19957|nr:hypothetical protein [Dyadobacter fanqingshengii]UTM21869.1 hypothetical protein NFI81_26300 [Dyadobacter fanqingshengii]
MIYIYLVLAVSIYGLNPNGLLKFNKTGEEKGQYIINQEIKYQMLNVSFSSAAPDNNAHPSKIYFNFLATNWYKKEIRAFRGTVIVKNIFGDVIKSIPLTYEKPIRARKGKGMGAMSLVQTEILVDRSGIKNLSLILINSEDYVKNHKSIWKTDKIIFMDGTEKDGDEFLAVDWELAK